MILDGTIEDYEKFIEVHSKVLHPNHYHMLTAKHTLCQMLGRTEGCVLQDMPIERVNSFLNYEKYLLFLYDSIFASVAAKRRFM